MALSFFTQKDIDGFDVNNIPEEFKNYFDGLSEERKAGIINSRPDLAGPLGYAQRQGELNVVEDFIEEISETDYEEEIVEEVIFEPVVENEVYQEETIEDSLLDGIKDNIYQYIDFSKYENRELNPFEALIIPDGITRCHIHRKAFTKLQFKFKSENGAIYSTAPFYCDECKRLYVEASKSESIEKALTNRGIHVILYPKEKVNAFIKSQLPTIEINKDTELFFPDAWVEDNPTCPLHHLALDECDCVIGEGTKSLSLKLYYCEKCDKFLLRRSNALDLEDDCAENGIPMPIIKPLVAKKQESRRILNKDIIPDYFIQDGEQYKYTYGKNEEIINLGEDDTIVVSDSIYCNLSGHEIDESMANIAVELKKGDRLTKNFVCSVGYCRQCEKYYLAEEDYKVVYSLGRPRVNVISDIEDSEYQITSGEVFELEKKHLEDLEADFDEITESIHGAKDYANQYETYKGGYDEGGLSVAKERSKRIYGKKLGEIDKYRNKPYSYRVDITFAGKTEIYYVGADDIELDDGVRVISYNSDFGRRLVNVRNINVFKDGKQYDIALTRQFDIEKAQLYGYANLRTADDLIFREGITDPFLVKVLKLRKQQHSLVDIIATVQENQNNIVDETLYSNLIVQGCAGSGKTMVLLHRLSFLKYNHTEFDFDDAVIITPNEQFNLHIQGLAEGLQIGNIRRLSVEEYYKEVLGSYDSIYVPKNAVANEIKVNQKFVDYIYSDIFIEDMDDAYRAVISERYNLQDMFNSVCEGFSEESLNFSDYTDDELISAIKQKNTHFEAVIAAQNQEYKSVKDEYDNDLKLLEKIKAELPKAAEADKSIIGEQIPVIYSKIAEYVNNHEQEIKAFEDELAGLQSEFEKTENQLLLPFRKRARLDEIEKEIKSVTRKRDNRISKFNVANEEFTKNLSELSDEDIFSWMQQVTLYIPDVREEVRKCENVKSNYKKLVDDKQETSLKVLADLKEVVRVEKKLYPEEVRKGTVYIAEKLTEFSDLNTYLAIYNRITSKYFERNGVEPVKGLYRYDLYTRLLFCMKYYKKAPGELKLICVDEGQDLAINEYKLISRLNQNKALFNVYGDTNQLLKPGRGIANWDSLIKLFDMKKFVLNENYRNTNQITRFCNDSFSMKVLQTGVDGPSVKEIRRSELEEELAKTPITSERVAILIPRSVRRGSYIKKELLPRKIANLISENIDNGLITLTYVDKVKGIEFDRVYVVSNKMTKNEKYIAYTRALTELIVVVDNKLTQNNTIE